MNRTGDHIRISVTVPVYNEHENVLILYRSIKDVLERTGQSYEIIFVDDGSSDGTRDILKEQAGRDPHFKIILFRSNRGQSAAMAAGFKASAGDIVIAMDGDLQNDPEDIPLLLSKIEEGYDVVAGWRKNRQDKLLIRKVPSRIANRLICSLTGVRLHDTGCSLKAFRREVIKHIRVYGELHRFIPVLARIEGARITEVVVNHRPRVYGESKYTITRTFRVIMDLISLTLLLKHLRNPLRFFGMLGAWFIGSGMIACCWLVCRMVTRHANLVDLNVPATIVFLLLAAGFQFLLMGLVASLIVLTGDRRGITVSPIEYNRTED
ncbi:glycosyltransferase family 2 protein [bacterium]|nr:glycosyltransferase family 2 protein [bacterium]